MPSWVRPCDIPTRRRAIDKPLARPRKTANKARRTQAFTASNNISREINWPQRPPIPLERLPPPLTHACRRASSPASSAQRVRRPCVCCGARRIASNSMEPDGCDASRFLASPAMHPGYRLNRSGGHLPERGVIGLRSCIRFCVFVPSAARDTVLLVEGKHGWGQRGR